MASSFQQAGAQLAGVAQQQTDLQRAVAAGELWMDAGVAERAAARCDQAVEEIDEWLRNARQLTGGASSVLTRMVKRPQPGLPRPARTSSTRDERSAGDREHGGHLPGGGAHVGDADATNEQMLRGRSG